MIYKMMREVGFDKFDSVIWTIATWTPIIALVTVIVLESLK